ncbi:MAG TPA: MFS transporter [Solirubrobacteraceae bacterium]|jgi:EmrB/QacA subfamily drug resistance transporter
MVSERPRQHYGVTLGVLTTGALAFALSQTMVAPALPEIQHALGTSTTGVTWVITIYLLTASVATPVLGRFGDMYGKNRMLVAVLAIFGVGSAVAALSSSIGVLILGRAIQGVGGAIFPLAFGIIRDEFPREKVATGIGLISATFGIGGGAGLVLSGVIVDHLDYEWIFWLGLAVVVPAAIATRMFIPESPVKTPARIDWTGAALLSAALVALLLAVSEGEGWGWTSPGVLGLFAAAAVIAVVWVRLEMRVPEPLVDMRMMRTRAVAATNLTGLFVGFGMFSSFIVVPQFVQIPTSTGYGFGASVTVAGLFLAPSAVVMLIGGPIAGSLGTRFGSRFPLLLGCAIATVAFVFLALFHDARWHIYAGTALQGVGISFAFASMANLIVEAVPQSATGVATGMNAIMRTIGGSLGAQVVASVIAASVVAGGRLPAESGFTAAFAIAAGGTLAALLAALAIPTRRRMLADARAAEVAPGGAPAPPAEEPARVLAGPSR